MIKTTDVLNAINDILAKKFNYTIYIDAMPEDFERPSFFIQLTGESVRDINISTVERTKKFRIICYDNMDADFNSDTLSLLEMQEEVCGLFESGKLIAGDRALNAGARVETNADTDIIYIGLEVVFFDDRGVKEEEFDLIGEVEVRKYYR